MLRRLAAIAACGVAVAACGSGHSANGKDSGSAAAVRFAACMRSHGVPSFPDPLPTGGFPRDSADGQSPASRAATRQCLPILRAGTARHRPSSAQLAAAVAYARCMRAHGVPGFPDPVTSLANPSINVIDDAGIIFPVGSMDTSAPAFQRADGACGQHPSGQPQGG